MLDLMIKNSNTKVHRFGQFFLLNRYNHIVTLVLSVALTCTLATAGAYAITSITQTYASNGSLPIGSIVSQKNDSDSEVIGADSNNVDNLIGVTVNPSNSALSISSKQTNPVQIASGGSVMVLVSDINGSITQGDHITASTLTGVGMKATTNVRIVGTAQGNLDNNTGSQQTYSDADGTKHTVLIGQIPVAINVSYYFKEPDKTLIPQSLQNIANSLAGKKVTTLPIVVSAAIFIVTIMVVVVIVYSMIKSSIISVGRNPMSQSAIYRDLIQISALVIVILGVGLVSIYLVLTRL
jgi:hypothetical protein